MGEYGNVAANPNEGCCGAPKRTTKDMVKETAKSLQEASMIVEEIKATLFGGELIDLKRPEANCMEEDIEMNMNGMQSLLCELNYLRSRLY